jgi:decaprenyl-phosphate phosphoribosyltransferase
MLRGLLLLARPRQQIKNLLVFAGPLAGGVIVDRDVVGPVALAFLAFVFVSISVYAFNDIRDVDADREHPKKRERPIASGAVSISAASVFAAATGIGGIALALFVSPSVFGIVAAYFAMTVFYSWGLKRVAVVEMAIVAFGFVLRALAGTQAASLETTEWFLLVIGAGAFLVVAAKRESEFGADGQGRPVLADYRAEFLAGTRLVMSALVLGFYALAAFDKSTGAQLPGVIVLSTLPFAVAILEFNREATRGEVEAPENLAFRNRTLLVAGLVWFAVVIIGLYGGRT